MDVKECLKKGCESLNGYWTKALIIGFTYLIICLITGSIHPFLSVAMGLWTIPSWAFVSLIIVRKKHLKISDFFQCFTSCGRFSQFVTVSFMNFIFILLWSFLIIMGYVKFIAYLMSYFIVAENNNVQAMEAIDQSMKMMEGKKCKLFCIHFVLALAWIIYIAIIILISLEDLQYGILLFTYMCVLLVVWYPFYFVCLANFYESIRPSNPEIDNMPEMMGNNGSFN